MNIFKLRTILAASVISVVILFSNTAAFACGIGQGDVAMPCKSFEK